MLAVNRSKFSVLWERRERRPSQWVLWKLGDLMRETPRETRYSEPAEQTPDQIVKKTLGSNLEKTMLKDLKRVVTKFHKLTIRLIRTRERYQSLVEQAQQIQQIQKGTCQLESNLFRFQSQRSLTTQLERMKVERWYLNLKARGET